MVIEGISSTNNVQHPLVLLTMNSKTQKYQLEGFNNDFSSTETIKNVHDNAGSQYFIGNGNVVSVKVDAVSGSIANNEVLYSKL